MLWRDTQLRLAILGVDALAWATLLVPAFYLRKWTFYGAFAVIAVFGVIRFFGITPASIAWAMRARLIGRIRPTVIRETLWRARLRRL